MDKIGLFGGTFDPPHNGHIAMVRAAREALSLDRVILIPSGDPPHKQNGQVTEKAQRFRMTELAFPPSDGWQISDYELKKETPSYTVELLRHFRSLYPADELFFLLGADSFADFPKWWHYRELLPLATFVVIARPGFDSDRLFDAFCGDETPPRVIYLSDVAVDISSTEIRAALRQGQDVSRLIPEAVLRYCAEHGLYQDKN